MRKLISIFTALFFGVMATAQSLTPLTPHPEGVAWPTAGWETGEMPAETAALVQPLIDRAMGSEKGEPMGETRAIVIIHGGQLVAETYRDGFTADTKQMSWSVAKSITSSLVGRAVHLGMIESIDEPMPSPFPEGDARADITWRQWLNMTDGSDYHEISEVPLSENDVAQMMFGRGRYDVAQYLADEVEAGHTPGEVWNYSTGAYHLIGWGLDALSNTYFEDGLFDLESMRDDEQLERFRIIFRMLYDQSPPHEFSQSLQDRTAAAMKLAFSLQGDERLAFLDRWSRSGMPNGGIPELGVDFHPEFDPAGTYLGGSSVWASAHDYAKFGFLYLRDGVWEGERLLPEGWVDFARTKTPGKNNNTYGAGFWITAYGEEPTTQQAPRSPPWDAFNANGSEGQTISIVPSRDLVIVRLGQMENTIENWNLLFEWNQEIARAFPQVAAN